MRKIIFFILTLSVFQLNAFAITGEEILEKIDKNMVIDQAITKSKMIIHGRSYTRTVQSRSYVKGNDRSFVEYLSPAREKGKKMLKLKNKLWTYTPEPTDRIITISGHLLRQSVMGGDLSYEDITENDKMMDMYNAKVTGEETFNGRKCYVVKLTAKIKNISYHLRKLWVDKEQWLPVKEERYARSGRLLKTFKIESSFKIGNRWYPKKMVFKDMLLKGKGTEYIIESIDFNVKIPDYKFTKASLRK